MPGVCIVGNLLIDLIVHGVDRLPTWGQEVAGSSHRFVSSGQAGYMAQGLAALEGRPRVMSVVGADDAGRTILADLAAAGVDVGRVTAVDDGATALTVAIVRADGERAFVSDFAALGDVDEEYVASRWPSPAEPGAICLVGLFNLPGLTLAAAGRLLRRARQEGRMTVLDTGWDPDDWPAGTVAGVRALLADVDVFVPNADEARVLTGCDDSADAADALHGDGAALVVVKCGPDGSVARQGHERWSSPGHRVGVHDTVGAGDVFDAGLVDALARGADVPAAMAWANAAAALYVSRDRNRFPSRGDVAAFAGDACGSIQA
jgi:ribokinase